MRTALLACAVLTACGTPPAAHKVDSTAAPLSPVESRPEPVLDHDPGTAPVSNVARTEAQPTAPNTTVTPSTTSVTRSITSTTLDPPSPQGRSTRGVGEPADVWRKLSDCESGSNPAADTGNGYQGAFQFSPATWASVGESGVASDYSYGHQLAAAKRLQARSGWGPWPACSRKLGLA